MSGLTVTWVRTSCLLLQHGDDAAITDPWFATKMRGLPIFAKPGIPIDRLPRISHVFASHLHPDHFDPAAVEQFGHPDLQLVGCPGTDKTYGQRLRGKVAAIHELPPWHEVTVGDWHLQATPAEHTGPPPPEVNYVIRIGGLTVFFGGDAKFSDCYRQIAERCGPIDLALLPIGGTLIFGHRTTMNPDDAVLACALLKPRWAIPIHEGGEWMPVPPASWHPGRCRHFGDKLRRSGLKTEPVVLQRGQPATFTPQGRAA